MAVQLQAGELLPHPGGDELVLAAAVPAHHPADQFDTADSSSQVVVAVDAQQVAIVHGSNCGRLGHGASNGGRRDCPQSPRRTGPPPTQPEALAVAVGSAAPLVGAALVGAGWVVVGASDVVGPLVVVARVDVAPG